jgi:hypothetical protein
MSENVVALRGEFTPPQGVVNARLVEELERLLESAKSGEIVGMAGSYLHKDRQSSWSFAGVVGSYGLIGGLECAKERLLRLALGS